MQFSGGWKEIFFDNLLYKLDKAANKLIYTLWLKCLLENKTKISEL